MESYSDSIEHKKILTPFFICLYDLLLLLETNIIKDKSDRICIKDMCIKMPPEILLFFLRC